MRGLVFHGDGASIWEEENTLGSWTVGRVVMAPYQDEHP